jgi:hypothetical protein
MKSQAGSRFWSNQSAVEKENKVHSCGLLEALEQPSPYFWDTNKYSKFDPAPPPSLEASILVSF